MKMQMSLSRHAEGTYPLLGHQVDEMYVRDLIERRQNTIDLKFLCRFDS